jgi:hypothetical protein
MSVSQRSPICTDYFPFYQNRMSKFKKQATLKSVSKKKRPEKANLFTAVTRMIGPTPEGSKSEGATSNYLNSDRMPCVSQFTGATDLYSPGRGDDISEFRQEDSNKKK